MWLADSVSPYLTFIHSARHSNQSQFLALTKSTTAHALLLRQGLMDGVSSFVDDTLVTCNIATRLR